MNTDHRYPARCEFDNDADYRAACNRVEADNLHACLASLPPRHVPPITRAEIAAVVAISAGLVSLLILALYSTL